MKIKQPKQPKRQNSFTHQPHTDTIYDHWDEVYELFSIDDTSIDDDVDVGGYRLLCIKNGKIVLDESRRRGSIGSVWGGGDEVEKPAEGVKEVNRHKDSSSFSDVLSDEAKPATVAKTAHDWDEVFELSEGEESVEDEDVGGRRLLRLDEQKASPEAERKEREREHALALRELEAANRAELQTHKQRLTAQLEDEKHRLTIQHEEEVSGMASRLREEAERAKAKMAAEAAKEEEEDSASGSSVHEEEEEMGFDLFATSSEDREKKKGEEGGEEKEKEDQGEKAEEPAKSAGAHIGFDLYDPSEYESLEVDDETRELFAYITRYQPRKIELDVKMRPFIPDYVPAALGPPHYDAPWNAINTTAPRWTGRQDWDSRAGRAWECREHGARQAYAHGEGRRRQWRETSMLARRARHLSLEVDDPSARSGEGVGQQAVRAAARC